MFNNDISAREIILNILPDADERRLIQDSQDFRNTKTYWNRGGWNYKQRVGNIMEAASELDISSTYEDWVEVYTSRCIGFDSILEQCKQLSAASGWPLERAVVIWWIHIIDSAYQGRRNEILVRAECEKKIAAKGLDVSLREPTSYEDTEYGVDLVATDSSGAVVFGIQVKTAGYFHSNRETVVKAREVTHPRAYRAFYDAHNGAKVWYAVIEDVLSGNPWNLKAAKIAGITN